MATKINKETTVTLQDGREVLVRPLSIKALRDFMKVVNKFGSIDFNEDTATDENFDLLVEAVAISFKKQEPDLAGDREYLEDNLDMPTIAEVLRVAGGIDIEASPNQMTTG